MLFYCCAIFYHDFMIVFIDGENFRQRLAETLVNAGLLSDRNARFEIRIRDLLQEALQTSALDIKYYESKIRLSKNDSPDQYIQEQIETIRNRQRIWVKRLKSQNIERIKAGTLKIRDDKPCHNCQIINKHLQEKGVDVRLALDIFESSLDNKNQEIAVFSSDIDICPAFFKAQKYGTKIKYICFDKFLNRGTSAAADETIKISTEKLVEFVKTY